MISIIIPNYNHVSFLPQRLDTIFNQTFKDYEVIILDDSSTDGSWDYLKQFEAHPKVSYCLRNEFNSGSPFKQWKKGLDLAKFDWIWIAESDDFSELEFLETLIQEIQDGVSVIFSKSQSVNKFGENINAKLIDSDLKNSSLDVINRRISGLKYIENNMIYKNHILNTSSVLFRKNMHFPSDILEMKYCGDWYFWLDRLRYGDLVFVPNIYNYFRFHSNTTRSSKSEEIELIRVDEAVKCILFAKKIVKKRFFWLIPDKKFTEYIYWFFKFRFKHGRFRYHSVFPRIPLFFYLTYYKFLFKSIIK